VNLRLSLFVLLAVALLGSEANAMKISVPEVSRYADASGKVTLEIPRPLSEGAARLHDGADHVWPGPTPVPSCVVFIPQHRIVALVGGIGDPGFELGLVELRSYEGAVLAKIDLNQEIPSLSHLSKTWQADRGNFPWIKSAAPSADGSVLGIDVCGKFAAFIDLASFRVDVEPLASPGAPKASRGPPRPVKPLVLEGVRYDPALGDARHLPTNRIAAYDAATGRELWRIEVYPQRYAAVPGLETDVQDAFITKLEADPKGGGLLVTDERGRHFRVDTRTHAVVQLRGS